MAPKFNLIVANPCRWPDNPDKSITLGTPASNRIIGAELITVRALRYLLISKLT